VGPGASGPRTGLLPQTTLPVGPQVQIQHSNACLNSEKGGPAGATRAGGQRPRSREFALLGDFKCDEGDVGGTCNLSEYYGGGTTTVSNWDLQKHLPRGRIKGQRSDEASSAFPPS
jgi:hypothetical protein